MSSPPDPAKYPKMRRISMRLGEARRRGGIAEVGSTVRAYAEWVAHGRPNPEGDLTVTEWLAAYSAIEPPPNADGSLISVVCPVFNTDPDLLGITVASVLAQSYERWELLLVNDGSKRLETINALARLASSDERIRVIDRADNTGVAAATNRGIEAANGEYVLFLDHDDLLAPTALAWCAACAPDADLVYSDEDKIDDTGDHSDPNFKPSWSPRLLLGVNYVNHLACLRTSLARDVGGLRSEYDGAQDHDLLLRLSEQDLTVAHVPAVLYHWRMTGESTAAVASAKPEAERSGLAAVQGAIERRGWRASAGLGAGAPFNYRVIWDPMRRAPSVKIVIPTRDRVDLLRRAVDGVLQRTDGVLVHLVIVDNGSEEPETISYLEWLQEEHPKTTVVRVDDAFNFSKLCNVGARIGPSSDFILFLNNDIEVLHRTWLQQLVGWFSDPGVVGVGPKMLFPDGTIQHGGVVLGMGGIAGHYAGGQENEPQVGNLHDQAREVGCLTAACLILRTDDFEAVGGFNEDLPVDFQDVDLCLKLRTALGGELVYDPTYPLLHVQSASRGTERASSGYTIARLRFLWADELDGGDPYFNPHFAIDRSDFALAGVDDLTLEERMERLQPRVESTTGRNASRASVAPAGIAPPVRADSLVPLLISGGGRNGTTLIMQLLATSPQIVFERVYPFEQRYLTYFLRWAGLVRIGIGPTDRWDQVMMVARKDDWIGPIPWVDPEYLQEVPECDEFHLEMFDSIWQSFSIRADLIATEKEGTEQGSTIYYAEKTPGWVRDELLSSGRPFKAIHPLRDPRDTYLSVLAFHKKRRGRGFGVEESASDEEYARRFAEGQRAALRRLLELEESDQDLIVRYEGLVGDLALQAKRLGTWLGVDLDADAVSERAGEFADHMTSATPKDSVARWRRELSSDLQDLFVSTLGDEIEAAGYEI